MFSLVLYAHQVIMSPNVHMLFAIINGYHQFTATTLCLLIGFTAG